jgi:beta-mannosidase
MDLRRGTRNNELLNTVSGWRMAFAEQPPATKIKDIATLEASGLTLYPATVPGNFELDLQANGLIEEPFYGMNIVGLREYERYHIWYACKFRADPPRGTQTFLQFDGIDCFARVYLNGSLLSIKDNALVEHRTRVPLQLENELVVHITPAGDAARRRTYPPSLAAAPNCQDGLYVRKPPHAYGWDIMPRALSAGLWRPVRLLHLPLERIETVFLDTVSIAQDHSSARLRLQFNCKLGPEVHGAHSPYEIEITGSSGDSRFQARSPIISSAGAIGVNVQNPRLWWPRLRGEQALYDVEVKLLKDGEVLDSVAFHHGIRTVALERTSITTEEGEGEFCFRINGERIFVMGSNWVPADAYHSRDVDRIPAMLDLAEEAGCNMLRCWGGNVYENDLFYEICDHKGIMIWQDFAMACAIYPQDRGFQLALKDEARAVVRRLRGHPCIVLWAGDNECDESYVGNPRPRDPNENVLTRQVLPNVVHEEDPSRPYLPSSPYIDPVAFKHERRFLSENHLWGPRDYYKSAFYQEALCQFASEIGYHGCPSAESIRKFISPERVWPYQDNPEWLLHSTSPIPHLHLYDYRVELMAKQVRAVFGTVPDTLERYVFASQAVQGEAFKFWIEMFRSQKWRRTGILWWNLIDGWPQFSDAVVDYYFARKLAYDYIKRSQAPLILALREPKDGLQDLVACNDLRQDLALTFKVGDGDTVVLSGSATAAGDLVTLLGQIPYDAAAQRFYRLQWSSELGEGKTHYLAGVPPFDLDWYERQLHSTFA